MNLTESMIIVLGCLAQEVVLWGLRGVRGSGCGLSSSCGGILWDDGTQAIPPSLFLYLLYGISSLFTEVK